MSYDLIIIGAGINGAGIARDAAMRGLKVLLIDKGDIGGGTTSWSSRLIHGGLRYLEYWELGLVRESLREREVLLKQAPHLVRPLPLLLPIYKRNSRGPLTIRAGMLAYDLLSFDKSLPRHRFLSRSAALERAPGLAPDGLLNAALYYDAQVEFPERLALENVLSAVEKGAELRTYLKVNRILVEHGQVCGVEVEDSLDSAQGTFRAPVVLNVAGPWVDEVLHGAVLESDRLIGGTKGTHIVVDPFPGAPTDALYVEALADKRPFFILPWNDLYLIGTTDARFEGSPDSVAPTDNEIDYLLSETLRVLPQAGLTRESVLYSYAGVRPLPAAEEGDPRGITRRHYIRGHAIKGLYSVVGGKLTTYRSLAEKAIDLVFKYLNRIAPKSETATMSLPGAPHSGFFEEVRSNAGGTFDQCVMNRLLRVYGYRTLKLLELVRANPELADIIDINTGAITAEIVFAFDFEFARTLTDFMMRRSMIGLSGHTSIETAVRAAEVGKRNLAWSPKHAEDELQNFDHYLQGKLPARIRGK
jgi:glycerol-3-phosphate dehydrogenase